MQNLIKKYLRKLILSIYGKLGMKLQETLPIIEPKTTKKTTKPKK
jgi:hypothetical protein